MSSSFNSDPPLPPPGSDVDLQDGAVVADLFDQAAEALLNHPGRRGAIVELPEQGRLLMSGDLHDHGLNLQRLIHLGRLEEREDHYLILHEIVHGPGRVNGRDLSVRTLGRVAALVARHPRQVLLMAGNHELAQLGGEGIVKEGVSMVEAFDEGVDFLYHDQAEAVCESMHRFIRAMLLGVRCGNGVFCAHSLPTSRKLGRFDTTILDRIPEEADLRVGGAAYDMVWGRNHTQKLADELAEAWDVRLFVLGHQPAEMGYELEAETILILASDHEHGMALPIRLDHPYADRQELVDELIPLASVVL